jgi:hypothetical protein
VQRKYLAFDIETAAVLSEAQFQNWRIHRPLGIICAAAQASDQSTTTIWEAKDARGDRVARMTSPQVIEFVDYLHGMCQQGYTLLTWNGVGFDWDVVAEESRVVEKCRELAMNHVDPMFHILCELGYPVSLEKAAAGCKMPGKTAGMAGFMAPQMWANGQYQAVLDYVAQDVRLALNVAAQSEQRRSFQWITQNGKLRKMPLPQGWLTVRDALRLPEPDTSWMSSPIPRRQFTEWLGGAPAL